MLIIYSDPGRGWGPITHMTRLAARLFDAELLAVDFHHPGIWKQLNSLFLRKPGNATESCLLIAPGASHLKSPLFVKNWRQRFGTISAWVIDSFWEDHIPKFMRYSHLYDHLFVTTQEDVMPWSRRVNAPVHVLPWGSDVLRLGGEESDRPWDLTRIGRQPPEWEEDEVTALSCHARKLSFHGRPAFIQDATEGQRALMHLYRRSKYLLAFSNATHPSTYTHPAREYLTARWVDALACGASVAGIPPKEASAKNLLWEGALLDLGTTDREIGLDRLVEALGGWSPGMVRNNHLQSLKRLDWRWRFEAIAEVMKITVPLLNAEIAELSARIAALEEQL